MGCLFTGTQNSCAAGNSFDKFCDGKTVTDEKLRDFSTSVLTKCLHAIRDIRIAWRRFLNSVFEYITEVRGIRKSFSSLQSAGQGPGFSSHSDSEFPLHRNAPDQKLRIGGYNKYIESSRNPVIVATPSGTNIAVFALAHCGVMGTLNRNGKKNLGLDQQLADWKRISLYL